MPGWDGDVESLPRLKWGMVQGWEWEMEARNGKTRFMLLLYNISIEHLYVILLCILRPSSDMGGLPMHPNCPSP